MTDSTSKLQDLVVDEVEVNESLLHQTLSSYVRIGDDSGDLIPEPGFEDLTARKKILVVLLAQRARQRLDMAEREWMSPAEIANQSGLKSGTVHPAVRELDNDNMIQGDDGEYRLPAHSIERAKNEIEED